MKIYWVAVGDLLLLLAFAVIGRWSHHELSGTGMWSTLGTAAPFMAGWIVTAPLMGAYTPRQLRTYGSAVVHVLKIWPVALLLALAIRSIIDREIPAISFVLVALLFNLLTLSVWRSLVVRTRQRHT